MNRKEERGFTLIEVMIVTAIVAILASIAYASYSSSVQKSRRSDAREALERIAAKQEQWFFQHNQYTDQMANLGGADSKDGFYTISVATNTITGTGCNPGECFTLTAKPKAVQADDHTCGVMSLDNLGRRAAKDSNNPNVDTTATCW